MELPQSRPFEAEGRRKQTHEFLSACSNSTLQPDPMPPSQGGYLKTQDFLQPLERVGTRAACAKERMRSSVDTTAASSELLKSLPGGIGTYTISHIPNYLYQQNQRSSIPKPEVSHQASSNAAKENSVSNSSSYAASGFTLWDQSVGGKKGNTRKENVKIQSQSFVEMMRSSKVNSQEEYDLLDDEDEEFVMKKENNNNTSTRVDLRVKVDGKGHHGNEQKPNTPRSKHSATEQRRRSKINDRFQMLRQLIPNSDQKRDKASFLLEVIEYINFLQEKVNKQHVVPYHQQPADGTVPVLSEAHQAVDMDQQCLNRAMETTPFPNLLGQMNSFFSLEPSQLCPVSSETAMESEKLREEDEEEELSVHSGTISISSVYSHGLLKTLTETLQTSGVDLSQASISVQIKLSKQPQKDEEVHRRVRPRSESGDDSHNGDDNNCNKQT